MSQCSTSSSKNAPTTETPPGAVPFKVARDIFESVERDSPLHGLVGRALIAKGRMELIDE